MNLLKCWPYLSVYALLTVGTAAVRANLAYDRSPEGSAKEILCAKVQVFEAALFLPTMLLQSKHLRKRGLLS